MISRISGRLLSRELDRAEVMTAGGVAYALAIPRTIFERLPPLGQEVELRTHQVVREDGIQLFGFLEDAERLLFTRLITAPGIGPKLALAMMSALPAAQLVRALRERDLTMLTRIPGVGKKTAERVAVDLSSRLDDLPIVVDARPAGAGVEEALRALTVLGFAPTDSERAVRAALAESPGASVQELIRTALAQLR